MSFKYALLGLLADGPRHGYELKNLYEERLVPSTTLNIGQVYPALERLRRDGWVQYDLVSQQERPDKKVYALTEEGRSRLEAWLEAPSRPNLDLRNEAFLKLMLARQLAGANPQAVVKVERRACLARLHELTQARTRARAEKERLQTILLLDLAVLRLEAFLKWLEHCDETLRQEGQS